MCVLDEPHVAQNPLGIKKEPGTFLGTVHETMLSMSFDLKNSTIQLIKNHSIKNKCGQNSKPFNLLEENITFYLLQNIITYAFFLLLTTVFLLKIYH